ncbi:MAG TPA: DUF411 domain-containing protein [Aliiroseovarius sp.]|nr:DUF411 domain-containing protein [Aliiroseovarius sp.]
MPVYARNILGAAIVGLGLASQAGASEHDIMTVFKSPTCGCCTSWADAMRSIGYQVEIVNLDDLSMVKQQAGVPENLEGCHTAVLDGYILEGHVPVQALEILLSERPDIRGISTPGMPAGSLGMGYDPAAKYTVFAFYNDLGQSPTVFYEAGQ